MLPTSAEMHHVGATAIPGCLTKGDLDIVIRVDAADFSQVDAQLAERFSRNLGLCTPRNFPLSKTRHARLIAAFNSRSRAASWMSFTACNREGGPSNQDRGICMK
ncbi:GrpB family protein [Bradyrhizobium sp. AZCC 1614]|uniref:GrpB family protein n=1 Tax=Bradyrhizobium sp. AZCC 1614 TaxID=3117017 RepID=UPI002FF3077D